MDFDSVFNVFINWQTILLCLSIYLITYTIRTIVENIISKVKINRYWNEIVLPLMPILGGAGLGLIPLMFPWPLNIGNFIFAKTMYGAICGLFSGWVYNRIKAWMASGKDSTTPSDTALTNTPISG